MIAIVGALVAAALLVAGLSGAVWHQHRRARRAEGQVAQLETRVSDLAETAAALILARRDLEIPARQEPRRPRHLRVVPGVLWPAAAVAWWEAARRHPAAVGATLAAATVAGLVALPLVAPEDPQPDRTEPPPVAGPPVVRLPDLPPAAAPETSPEPAPELEPEPAPEGGPPRPAPFEQPVIERVAVVEPAPISPAPSPEPPESTPAPEPSPQPPPEPVPSPEPPAPPAPGPPPADPPPDDDTLLCLKLLRLPELCLP